MQKGVSLKQRNAVATTSLSLPSMLSSLPIWLERYSCSSPSTLFRQRKLFSVTSEACRGEKGGGTQ